MTIVKRLFVAAAILVSAGASAQVKNVEITKNYYEKTGETCFAGISVEDRDGNLHVTEVVESQSASGFRKNDRITGIGSQKIGTVKEWDKAMKGFKPGMKIQVQVERDGKSQSVEVELEKIDVYGRII